MENPELKQMISSKTFRGIINSKGIAITNEHDRVFDDWKKKCLEKHSHTRSCVCGPIAKPEIRIDISPKALASHSSSRDLSYIREKLSQASSNTSMQRKELTQVLTIHKEQKLQNIDQASRILYQRQTDYVDSRVAKKLPALRNKSKGAKKRGPTSRKQVELLNHWLDKMMAKHVADLPHGDARTKAAYLIIVQALKETSKQVKPQCYERSIFIKKLIKLMNQFIRGTQGETEENPQTIKHMNKLLKINKSLKLTLRQKQMQLKDIKAKLSDAQIITDKIRSELTLAQESRQNILCQYERIKTLFTNNQPITNRTFRENKFAQLENASRTVITSTSDLQFFDTDPVSFNFKVNKKISPPHQEVKLVGFFDKRGGFHRKKMIRLLEGKKEITEYKNDKINFAQMQDKSTECYIPGIFVPQEKLQYIDARIINLDSLDSISIGFSTLQHISEPAVDLQVFKDNSTLHLQSFNKCLCKDEIQRNQIDQMNLVLNSHDSVNIQNLDLWRIDAETQTVFLSDQLPFISATPSLKHHKKAKGRAAKIMTSLAQLSIESKLNSYSNHAFKNAMKLITSVYIEKIGMDKQAASNKAVSLSEVLYNKFLFRFGLKQVAEKKYKKTVSQLAQLKQNIRVSNFLRFLGLLEPYDIHDLRVYLSLYDSNYQGIGYLNEEGSLNYNVSYSKCISTIKNLLQANSSRSEWERMREELQKMRFTVQQNLKDIDVLDVDNVAKVTLDGFNMLKTRAINFMRSFDQSLTMETEISLEGLHQLVSRMPEIIPVDEVERIFNSYSHLGSRVSTVKLGFIVCELIQKLSSNQTFIKSQQIGLTSVWSIVSIQLNTQLFL